MNRRGYTLIELMVAVIIIGVVMSALLTTFIAMWKAQAQSITMPATQQEAQQITTTLASAFRGAVNCATGDSGCTVGNPGANPTSTGCTLYSRNSSGTLVATTYAVSGGTFQTTVNGTTTTQYSGATVAISY